MRARKLKNLVAITATLGCLAGMLAGCVGMAVGAGAAGGTLAAQERGLKGGIDDAGIRLAINELWFTHDEEMYRKITLSISEGRVLLTGRVEAEKLMFDAVRLSWKAKGVKEVINEVQVQRSDDAGIGNFFRDMWISTRLKTKLAFDDSVSSINYSIDTVSGVVYLFGIARNQEELRRVTNHAKDTEYVRRVVNHVWLRGDPRRTKTDKS
jgi:osmotically-inducible protein OsmY